MDLYLGLGSNLGDRKAFLDGALQRLGNSGIMELKAVSSIYETAAVDYTDQPDFLNCVAHFNSEAAPEAILAFALQTERALGRQRDIPKGPRTLDIDLLLYGNIRQSTPHLTLPHPAITQRAFVLSPLEELAPALVIEGKTATQWLEQVSREGIVKFNG